MLIGVGWVSSRVGLGPARIGLGFKGSLGLCFGFPLGFVQGWDLGCIFSGDAGVASDAEDVETAQSHKTPQNATTAKKPARRKTKH